MSTRKQDASDEDDCRYDLEFRMEGVVRWLRRQGGRWGLRPYAEGGKAYARLFREALNGFPHSTYGLEVGYPAAGVLFRAWPLSRGTVVGKEVRLSVEEILVVLQEDEHRKERRRRGREQDQDELDPRPRSRAARQEATM